MIKDEKTNEVLTEYCYPPCNQSGSYYESSYSEPYGMNECVLWDISLLGNLVKYNSISPLFRTLA